MEDRVSAGQGETFWMNLYSSESKKVQALAEENSRLREVFEKILSHHEERSWRGKRLQRYRYWRRREEIAYHDSFCNPCGSKWPCATVRELSRFTQN